MFLNWLANDHFTFLGFREYELVVVDGEDTLRVVPGSGLGILRPERGSRVCRRASPKRRPRYAGWLGPERF